KIFFFLPNPRQRVQRFSQTNISLIAWHTFPLEEIIQYWFSVTKLVILSTMAAIGCSSGNWRTVASSEVYWRPPAWAT
ncbi:MAG: hypothetical protein WCJ75_08060, partial [Desulfomonile sp.]